MMDDTAPDPVDAAWGFITAEGNFVEVPRAPCIAAGYTTPPFTVQGVFGMRTIIRKPDREP